jgi:hypothetical protein
MENGLQNAPALLAQFTSVLAGSQDLVLTWDIGVILFLFVAIFFYGLNAGRKRLGLFIVSFYGSIAFVHLFPLRLVSERAEGISEGIVSLAVLVVSAIVFYFVLAGSVIKPALPLPSRGKGHFWQVLLLSVALSGFLISVVGSMVAPLATMALSTPTHTFFISEYARFVWAFAPLVAIFIAAQRRDK